MELPAPSPADAVIAQESIPLVVDLDGTLIASDTLFEGVASLIRRDPGCIPKMAVWLGRGRASLKDEIAQRTLLDVAGLPYRTEVVEYLRKERASGRKIVLATAANVSIARQVADHLGLFDEVLASSHSVNLKGTAKRDELVRRFGIRGFDYIGDSVADVPVWQAGRIAHLAGSKSGLPPSVLKAGAEQGKRFPGKRPGWFTLIRAMRVHQWVKNLLVFAPTLLNHQVNWGILGSTGITFLGFSLVASGTYLANDLFDLEADRRHRRKCNRPLASGQLSIPQGLALAIGLPLMGILAALLVSGQLVACLLAYLALTITYSAFLKSKPIIDVVVLAVLYTLRLYTGGLVTGAYVSPWLFQFSIFLFLSLAFVKRYSELLGLRRQKDSHTAGRGYRLRDLGVVGQAGLGSGLMAGLVLALYVNAREIQGIYPHPQMLWGMCPLFVYWIIRVWLIAHRGNMHEDPILFAFRDRVSYIVGFLIVGLMVLGLMPNV